MGNENVISRRRFCHWAGTGISCLLASGYFSQTQKLFAAPDTKPPAVPSKLKEAMFYDKLNNNRVMCTICPRECTVRETDRGYCGNRENRNGTYYALVHSRPCTIHIDPIEKKPFFHFLPTSLSFSLATTGCNFECKYCQNWDISQMRPEQVKNLYLPPEEVVKSAKQEKCLSIACTYSEPIVYYEYTYDIAVAAKAKGVRTVMVSNGYINREPMVNLAKQLTAVKIDLKSFNEEFYRKICAGKLRPVLDTLVLLKELDKWFEIVYLVIPTLNDNPDEIRKMSRWILSNLGPDVPVHFSRFHPMYKLQNLPPTPTDTLDRCRTVAREVGLRYVYLGNVPGHEGENTYCPTDNKLLIARRGFTVLENHLTNGKCKYCQTPIPGVWN